MQTSFTLADGTTVIPFPFKHNWATAAIERVGYLSDIMRSFSGKEQRALLRSFPRRTLEYRHLAHRTQRAFLEHLLTAGHSSKFAVPIWADARRSIGNSGNGLYIDTEFLDYETAGMVMLFNSAGEFETHQIAVVGSTTLALSHEIGLNFQNEIVAVPCRAATLEASTAWRKTTSDLIEATLQWQLLPGQPDANRFADPDLPTYEGRPVFRAVNDWSEGLSVAQTIGRDTLDFEIGQVRLSPMETCPTSKLSVAQLFNSRQQIAEFLGFLDSVKGSLKGFWLHLPMRELPLHPTNGDQLNDIYIERVGYPELLFDLPNRRRVAVAFRDGETTYHEVTNASVSNATQEVLNVTPDDTHAPSIGTRFNRDVSFLRYCRLEANEIEIAWQTSTVASINVAFQELTTLP